MYSFKDRLIDWANSKSPWVRIWLAVGITLLIVAVILAAAMPGKGAVNANAAAIHELQGTMGTVSDQLDAKASQVELDSWSQSVSGALGVQAGDISSLGNRVGDAETRISVVENNITAIICSPPEAYLTGTFGNYTLHIIASEANNFTANVHLVYSPSVGNATSYAGALADFYGSINWTGVNVTVPAYVPVATFNGTAWGITEVWFNAGTFEVSNTTTIDITCIGLQSTWDPSFAYAEVFPVLDEIE